MGLFDSLKKKAIEPVTPVEKKVIVVPKPIVQKAKVIEKIGKFYRTEDGIWHKKYNLTGTQYKNRPKTWSTIRIGDPVKLRFYNYEGDPAVEVIHKNGALANIKAVSATQVTSYKDLLTGGSVFSAQAQVRRIRSVVEINFIDNPDKIRELADKELLMTDALSDTRVKKDLDEDDDGDNDE